MPVRSRFLLLALAAALAAAGPRAQTPQFLGPGASNSGYGAAIAGVPDADGDGRGDVLVGAPRETVSGVSTVGRAYLYSGATGALLRTLDSPNPQTNGGFGTAVAGVPDADGDGRGDLLVGAPGEAVGTTVAAGRAYLFSGATGAFLRTIVSPNAEASGRFGVSVAAVRDVNGDGRGDLVVGAPGELGGGTSGQGRAYLFSGGASGLLRTLTSPQARAGGEFGIVVAGLPDASGDGRDDVIVSTEGESLQDRGAVHVFSGAAGTLLRTLSSQISPQDGAAAFGRSVAGVPDANGDGRGDVLVGSPTEQTPSTGGSAVLFSGATGDVLRTFINPSGAGGGLFGSAVAGVPDADGDGRGDVLIASREDIGATTNVGRVYLFSGAGTTYVLLRTFEPAAPLLTGALFGQAVAGIPDANGRGDVAIGAARTIYQGTTATSGSAYHYRNQTRTLTLAGAEGWRLLAYPVLTSPVQLLGPAWTQGAVGADDTDGDPNVYRYFEQVPGPRDDGYTPVTRLDRPAEIGLGYAVYVFADDDMNTPGTQGGFPKALPAQGLTYDGRATAFPVSFTLTPSVQNDGWNLLGNPYRYPLDWDATGWTKTHVANTIYVYDAVSATYRTWNGTTGSLGSGLIGEFQGFWVKADDENPALIAPFSAAVSTPPSASPLGPALELVLTGAAAGRPVTDAAFVAFVEGADDGVDPYDAYELAPFARTFATLHTVAQDALLDIEARAPLAGSATFALAAAALLDGAPTGGAFTLAWPDLSRIPAAWTLTLTDTETGAVVDLRADTAYAFTLDAAARVAAPAVRGGPPVPTPLRAPIEGDGAARTPPRFVLSVRGATVAGASGPSPRALTLDTPRPNPAAGAVALSYALPEAGPVQLRVFDTLGRRVATVEEGARAAGHHTAVLDAARLPSGVYVVRLEAGGVHAVRRLTVVR